MSDRHERDCLAKPSELAEGDFRHCSRHCRRDLVPGWYWARRRAPEPSRGFTPGEESPSKPVIVRVGALYVECANLSIIATIARFLDAFELGPRVELPEGW